VTEHEGEDRGEFREAVEGLLRGDFSRLEPLFLGSPDGGGVCPIVRWFERRWFDGEPAAANEALTCACFLGRTEVAALLMDRGRDPSAGAATGFEAFHWAANRGQLDAVRLLLARKAPLEARNRFGGTVLGTTVWSAIHEPRPDHLGILEELIAAGARLEDAGYPTGDERVDEMLRRHGAVAARRGTSGGLE
jgi:hypothetical protein